VQTAVGFVVKIFGQIFCRRVQIGERLYLINHLMIQTVDDRLHHVTQIFEIEEQTGFVEFLASEGDPNLVVVAVRILALPTVTTQVVPCGERIFDSDLEHYPPRNCIPKSRDERDKSNPRILRRDNSP
jgi:hypothetical protein